MIPEKIQQWLSRENFPQRILLSGGDDAVGTALEIAEQLQQVSREKIEKGVHLDTVLFRDDGKSFKIDFSDTAKKDGQNEHENVRGLIRWCSQTPNEGKYRIVILEHLERLSYESPHAFLKLIEEPPKHVIFLFTTQNHHQMLETILSRVTVVRLPKTEKSFEVLPDIQQFFESPNLIFKFQKIEELDKIAKNRGEGKMDRSAFFEFLNQLIAYARHISKCRKHLELLWETYVALEQNVNPKLALERVAVKMGKV